MLSEYLSHHIFLNKNKPDELWGLINKNNFFFSNYNILRLKSWTITRVKYKTFIYLTLSKQFVKIKNEYYSLIPNIIKY